LKSLSGFFTVPILVRSSLVSVSVVPDGTSAGYVHV
jgi:hypothetical protein